MYEEYDEFEEFDDFDNDAGEAAEFFAWRIPRLLDQIEELPFFHLGFAGGELKDSITRFAELLRRFPKNVKADSMNRMIDEAYLGKIEGLVDFLKDLLPHLESVAEAPDEHLRRAEQKAKALRQNIDQKFEYYKTWAKNEAAWTEFLYESRSQRKPAFYRTKSVNPSRGKSQTSRRIRSSDKQQMHDITREVDAMTDVELLDEIDPFLDDPQFMKRGSAGTRSPDRGWDDFGDGRVMPQDLEDWPEDYRYKMTRK